MHRVEKLTCRIPFSKRLPMLLLRNRQHYMHQATVRPSTISMPAPSLWRSRGGPEFPAEPNKRPTCIRTILFATTGSAFSFLVAGVVCEKEQEILWRRLQFHRDRMVRSTGRLRDFILDGGGQDVALGELWREQKARALEKKRILLDRIQRRLDHLATIHLMPEPFRRLCLMIALKYTSMTDAERTLSVLVGLNTIVFGMWQIRRCQPFMARWFLHHPASRRSVTLLTSCFSHKDLVHFGVNMIGLWSFGGILHDTLGREQFLAFYLSAGMLSGLGSHLLGLATHRFRPLLPSLGASGALYACLASTAWLYPNASAHIVFLPFVPIKLGYVVPALIGVDLAGIMLRWRMFDHYAHLSGALLGLGYMAYGQQYIWLPLLRQIREVRDEIRRRRGGNGNGDGGSPLVEVQRPRWRWIGSK